MDRHVDCGYIPCNRPGPGNHPGDAADPAQPGHPLYPPHVPGVLPDCPDRGPAVLGLLHPAPPVQCQLAGNLDGRAGLLPMGIRRVQ